MIRSEFSLDYTQSGFVVSAFSLAYGIGHVPAGWLADHIGRRIMITVGICGVALAGLLVGLSHTYIMMVVFLALMGLMGGGYHSAAPPLISASVDPNSQGRALGIHMIGGSLSFFLAPLTAAAIAIIWGWRGSFVTLAVPTFLFGIVFYWFLGRIIETKKVEQREVADEEKVPPIAGRWRRLVVFIVLSAFTMAVFVSTTAFVPLYLVDHFGVSEEAAASFIAFLHIGGLWAGPLGGYLSDKLGRVPVILMVCSIAGPSLFMLNIVPFGIGIGTLLIVLGMLNYIRMPVTEAYIVNQTSEHRRSTVLGVYYFVSAEGGGLLTPFMGYLIDLFGFYNGFTIAGASVAAMTLICSIGLWRTRAHN